MSEIRYANNGVVDEYKQYNFPYITHFLFCFDIAMVIFLHRNAKQIESQKWKYL